MPEVDPAAIVPNAIFGVLAIAIGVVITINRASIYRAIARGTARPVREFVARGSSSFWIGAVGISCGAIGVLMIAGAVMGIAQL